MRIFPIPGALLLGALMVSLPALGEPVKVSEAWIRLMPGGGPSAGYFRLENTGEEPLILESADCPGFGRTGLHRSIEEGGTSRMEHVENLPLPAGETVVFQPGGYHLMLMAPTDPPKAGAALSCTLRFAAHGPLRVKFSVRPPYAQGP